MTQHYGAIQGLGALGPNVVCVSPMFLVIVELVKGQHLEKYYWWFKDDNFQMQWLYMLVIILSLGSHV